MRPIDELSAKEARGIDALLFDLDDTVLDRGSLTEIAYSSLFRLKEQGLLLVAVTGRPSGWAEVLARQWPIDGVVAENGAVAAVSVDGKLGLIDFAGDARPARQDALGHVVKEVRARFPVLFPSDDVGARRSDFTFDIGEHRRVPADIVRDVRRFVRTLGARTILSSVHLHVTLDGLDKASGVTRFLGRFGWDTTSSLSRGAFIGDSENDEACFCAFRTTIAVHNFVGRPTVTPRYVTQGERGAGFAEAARVLIARRNAC
jgi:HAD superfamily hydrolase (TIGR01484 family)